MVNVEKIIAYLDTYSANNDFKIIGVQDASSKLRQKGLLAGNIEDSEKALIDLLEKDLIPHAIQATNGMWVIPHSSYKSLQELIRNQYLIILYMNEKLKILNYLATDLLVEVPEMYKNIFIGMTAVQYYRSIVVDLSTLFIESNSQKNNFYGLLSPKFNSIINDELRNKISLILYASKNLGDMMKELRDKEYSHYDFGDKAKISLNFDLIKEVNELANRANLISSYCNAIVELGPLHVLGTLDSLKELIVKFKE